VWRAKLSLAALILASPSLLNAAEPPAAPPAVIAHSALVTLEGAPSASGITLRVRSNAAGGAALTVSEIAVSLDGRPQTVTARADGGFDVALTAAARRGEGHLEVTVAHDGIREVLTGQLPRAAGGAAPGAALATSASRKQLWWWVLNIAVVLVGALAIARRMS